MRLGWKHPEPMGWLDSIEAALKEDLGTGDISAVMIEPEHKAHWFIEVQAHGVLCGAGIAAHMLADPLRPESAIKVHSLDGERAAPGDKVISGISRSAFLLSRERTVLNYLMLLSGVATLTAKYVDAVAGTKAQILDTRKTVPGLRALQKYAVRCGGGRNHRMGLYDGILIKDNHIRVAGSITEALARARANAGHMVLIEVECETLDQVEEALKGDAHVIMVDNMAPPKIKEAVALVDGRAVVEASGGVSLDNVREIAEAGVDVISIGALTHSAPSLALHLEVE